MAQNQFINITADGNVANRKDSSDCRHGVSNGAAAAGDLTLSWDSAKFTTRSQIHGAWTTILKQLSGQLPP
jgi:hypothetical protein